MAKNNKRHGNSSAGVKAKRMRYRSEGRAEKNKEKKRIRHEKLMVKHALKREKR